MWQNLEGIGMRGIYLAPEVFMTIILAIFSGLGLGYIIEGGALCFYSTLFRLLSHK